MVCTQYLHGQAYADLSNVRVEELTDEQVNRFLAELTRSGISPETVDAALIDRGLNPAELAKLKIRLKEAERYSRPSGSTPSAARRSLQDSLLSLEKKPLADMNSVSAILVSQNYGFDVFHNPRTSFEPNLNIPTPRNYQLATNDELIIEVSGASEARYALKVSPEGIIRIPVAGPIQVSGLTIEQAGKKIKTRLASTIYRSIDRGKTFVDVSLGAIRSIRVTIIGEAYMSGTYTLPSVATVFHALHACGGASRNGTIRNIRVIRQNKTVRTIDVYAYLLNGDKSADMILMDQDVIRIAPFETRVELKGEVRKPGFYDILPGENLSTIVGYAGGFTDHAYTARLRGYRNTATERSIFTLAAGEIANHVPRSGDSYVIDRILNRFANRVSLKGAVYRPGEYELKEGMTLKSLISEADGLREDAYLSRGTIHRLKPDMSPQMRAFDLERIMRGEAEDIPLQREDRVVVYSRFDLKESQYVSIEGEVITPGTFLYEEGMKVEDLILMSGGLKEASSPRRVEISRRVRDTLQADPEQQKTALILQQDLSGDLRDSSGINSFTLQPFDEVVIRTSPGYFVQKNAVIEGEVLYAGKYTLERKNDRISDLVKRSGGLTPEAYVKGAILVRTRKWTKTEQANFEQGLKNLVKQNVGSGTPAEWIQYEVNDVVQKKSDFIGINLAEILENPGSKYDLLLNDGDTLRIPKQLQTVRVAGEVLYPTLVRYDRGMKFKKYINHAGGFADRALRRNTYVVHPNGSVEGTTNFLFFKNYPDVHPGSEIFVPTKKPKERLSTGAIVGLAATLVSMLAIVFSAIQ